MTIKLSDETLGLIEALGEKISRTAEAKDFTAQQKRDVDHIYEEIMKAQKILLRRTVVTDWTCDACVKQTMAILCNYKEYYMPAVTGQKAAKVVNIGAEEPEAELPLYKTLKYDELIDYAHSLGLPKKKIKKELIHEAIEARLEEIRAEQAIV